MASPGSAPLDPRQIDVGIEFLSKQGRTILKHERMVPHGYLAATDVDRADQLNRLFRNRDLDVILCSRGGYGSLRILDQLDYDALRSNPKLVIGYSDVTAVQLAIYAETGLPAISGPMVAIEWALDDYEKDDTVWDLLSGACPAPVLGPKKESLEPIREGSVTGKLLGGNLSIICKLVGTPYLPDLTGSILFIEEVSELPYRIDGLLAQLRLSGVLGRLGGLVVGELTPPDVIPDKPTLVLDEILSYYASAVDGPVARNLRYGHTRSKVSVPIGVSARLDVSDRAELIIMESVVASDSNSDVVS